MASYLLDTHVFLWWIGDSSKISPLVKNLITDQKNEIFVSVVSAWEIAIKASLGRLSDVGNPSITVPEQLEKNGFGPLPLQLDAALYVFSLPPVHTDPFDRMLIAQAKTLDLPFVSSDRTLRSYPVSVIW